MRPRPAIGLSAIVGPPGRGKTLTATYYAILYRALGWEVWGNYSVRIDGWHRIATLEELAKAHGGLLVLDEAWTVADSRKFMTRNNLLVDTALLQARKHDLDVILVTQDFAMLDVRLRQNTHRIIVPTIDGPPPRHLRLAVHVPTIDRPESALAWRQQGTLLDVSGASLDAVMAVYDTREVVIPLARMLDDAEAKQPKVPRRTARPPAEAPQTHGNGSISSVPPVAVLSALPTMAPLIRAKAPVITAPTVITVPKKI